MACFRIGLAGTGLQQPGLASLRLEKQNGLLFKRHKFSATESRPDQFALQPSVVSNGNRPHQVAGKMPVHLFLQSATSEGA